MSAHRQGCCCPRAASPKDKAPLTLLAFVNHKKITEVLSEALESITEHLTTVYNSIAISATDQMRRLVADLYVAVFKFLCAVMDWYGGRADIS